LAVTRSLGQMAIRMCVVATVAFVFTGWRPFRRLVVSCVDRREKFALIFIFGIRGIMGTYSGVPVLGAIANHRAHAVRTARVFDRAALRPAVGAFVPAMCCSFPHP